MQYPGDTADPKDVAKFFAHVAKEEFDLPGILPVMCSAVELTDAWTGPGDVKDVPGYLYSVDHDSLGYFQQRPGWGTAAQRTDANYALRAFCNAARNQKDYEWHENTTDPYVLGRWCQKVQVSAYPERYAEKGYPMALELLRDENNEPQVWPQKLVEVSSDGWAFVRDGGEKLWLRGKPQLLYVSDPDGWLTQERFNPPSEAWEWPVADKEPGWLGDSSYVDLYPTRYNWLPERPDVEAIARRTVDKYPGKVWANTYYRHPPDVYPPSREKDSVDFWGYTGAGRGTPIDTAIGHAIWDELFNDPNPPDWDWGIWQGWMWSRSSGGWVWWGDHWDHIHITYL